MPHLSVRDIPAKGGSDISCMSVSSASTLIGAMFAYSHDVIIWIEVGCCVAGDVAK